MGVVSFAVGADGATYRAPNGKEYQLSGWTAEALAAQERFLEQRAQDALGRIKMTPEQRVQATSALVSEIACFGFGYGSERWSKAIQTQEGASHFFWVLLGKAITLEEARALVKADPEGTADAMFKADPTNRATAEPPKSDHQN